MKNDESQDKRQNTMLKKCYSQIIYRTTMFSKNSINEVKKGEKVKK